MVICIKYEPVQSLNSQEKKKKRKEREKKQEERKNAYETTEHSDYLCFSGEETEAE